MFKLCWSHWSGTKDENVKASNIFHGPEGVPEPDKQEIIANLAKALYASKICSYAQGLGIIKAALDKFGWDIDLSEYVKL